MRKMKTMDGNTAAAHAVSYTHLGYNFGGLYE